MSNKVEYFLDCSSPWTYLSFRGMQELSKRKSFEIIWKPILVGGIFNTINPSVYESRQNPIKEKLVYSQKDLEDWSKSRGLNITMPKVFPVNSVKAMRGSFFFQDAGKIEDYLEADLKQRIKKARKGDWVPMFPDCCRWISKGQYEQFLELRKPENQSKLKPWLKNKSKEQPF